MTTKPLPLSFQGIVRSVALQFGVVPNEDEIGYVLWNHTGYPSFFHRNRAVECAEQVQAFYEQAQFGYVPCACCGRPAEADFVCEPCARELDMREQPAGYRLPSRLTRRPQEAIVPLPIYL